MKETGDLRNQLKAIRTRLGLSQQDLATSAGVARQTIGGIEGELYAPSAAVALRLAKALGCRVEEIFWLEDNRETVHAVLASPPATLPQTPMRVTLAQIENRWVASPLIGDAAFRVEMVPADGVGTWNAETGTVTVQLLDESEALMRTVLLAGCTPALSLWAKSAERWYPGLRVHWRHANSMVALEALARGEVHAAGIHLFDAVSGEGNSAFVQRVLPKRNVALVTLGTWEEGFLVAPGNPKRILTADDLSRQDVVLINREMGSGARLMLDTTLQEAGVNTREVMGYATCAHSHLEVAEAVSSGRADVGVSAAAVAMTYGLDFLPLHSVRYDLALLEETMQLEPVRQLLSTLQHRWVRSQLALLGGYDTTHTGEWKLVGV